MFIKFLVFQTSALLFISQHSQAADSYRVVAGDTVLITEHGTSSCVKNAGTQDVFVPTRTSGEWAAFRGNLPPNVTNTCCAANYVLVPGLAGYSPLGFCVAKYEMKNVGSNVPGSVAAGTPWGNINRATAISECASIGQTLLTNNQWQTIARNIADTAWNWSTGTAYSGQLNVGHSDNSPATYLAAGADSAPCTGTGQTCSETTWNSQRRTHRLSNGETIWDIAGNSAEWVQDNNTVSQGADIRTSQANTGDNRQTKFGNDQFCASPNSTPFCGMGFLYSNYAGGAILRGGSLGDGDSVSVFMTDLQYAATFTYIAVGFRCAYVP